MLIHDAEINGTRRDVLIRNGRISAVGASIPRQGHECIDARGGALLPGLHDHHVHLNAMAAARRSVVLDPSRAAGAEALAQELRSRASHGSWLRVTQYHEDMAGPLDRRTLGTLLGEEFADTPVRVQHRSGALWVLNDAAIQQLTPHLGPLEGVERDASGQPTGRLWRSDHGLRDLLPTSREDHIADLASVARSLIAAGVTGVTDATPELGASDFEVLSKVAPLRVVVMAEEREDLWPEGSWGPRKLVIADHALPTAAALAERIRNARGSRDRRVAVHCVSLESLVLLLAALEVTGSLPGDRIEHGAVIPDALVNEVANMGLAVVTQPDFLRLRGTTYRQHADDELVDDVYRYRGLLDAGITVVPSSDGPYASTDPWQVIRSAVKRVDLTGVPLNPRERVQPATALDGYLRHPLRLDAPARRIGPGRDADLCLLRCPLDDALRNPSADNVRATWIGGQLVHLDS